MRYAEYALFSVPFLLILAWWFGIRGLSRRGLVASVLALALVGGVLVWMGEQRGFLGRYVPAQFSHGKIVPGGGS